MKKKKKKNSSAAKKLCHLEYNKYFKGNIFNHIIYPQWEKL